MLLETDIALSQTRAYDSSPILRNGWSDVGSTFGHNPGTTRLHRACKKYLILFGFANCAAIPPSPPKNLIKSKAYIITCGKIPADAS